MFRSRQLKLEIPPELHSLLERAAALEGRTVNEFVVEALRREAHTVLADVDVIHLTRADQEAVVRALINPPPPNAALTRAFLRSKKLFG